jgi:O-antigen biosynthesis protein WbqP
MTFGKRAFDIIFALLLVFILFIPMVFIAIAVAITSDGAFIFWSDRVGRDNELFQMPKFRTMKQITPVIATHLLSNPHIYLTSIGRFLRKTNLDELPQLYSILRGHMSFVGPRPALFNQYDLIELRTKYHLDKLVPGLTGWAQMNGRDTLSIAEKVYYDLEYSYKKSFFLIAI